MTWGSEHKAQEIKRIMGNKTLKTWPGLFLLVSALCACAASVPPTPEQPPRTGAEFLSRLEAIAEHGWETEPDRVGIVLGTTFTIKPGMPNGRTTTCPGWQHSWEAYDASASFWFRRTLPPGPDRTAPPGTLAARFIPRDPKFRYSTYVLDDCRPRADVQFDDVDSWLCISSKEVENAGYTLHLVFDAAPAFGREVIRKHTGSSTAVDIAFTRKCVSRVFIRTFYPSALEEYEERLRKAS